MVGPSGLPPLQGTMSRGEADGGAYVPGRRLASRAGVVAFLGRPRSDWRATPPAWKRLLGSGRAEPCGGAPIGFHSVTADRCVTRPAAALGRSGDGRSVRSRAGGTRGIRASTRLSSSERGPLLRQMALYSTAAMGRPALIAASRAHGPAAVRCAAVSAAGRDRRQLPVALPPTILLMLVEESSKVLCWRRTTGRLIK